MDRGACGQRIREGLPVDLIHLAKIRDVVEVDATGEWSIAEEGNNVKAEFRDASGQLLGFALTGEATKEKMALQKELPAIL